MLKQLSARDGWTIYEHSGNPCEILLPMFNLNDFWDWCGKNLKYVPKVKLVRKVREFGELNILYRSVTAHTKKDALLIKLFWG